MVLSYPITETLKVGKKRLTVKGWRTISPEAEGDGFVRDVFEYDGRTFGREELRDYVSRKFPSGDPEVHTDLPVPGTV